MSVSLLFGTDGTAGCLYTEEIDIASIGSLEIRRATSIEFDNDLQAWRVTDPEGFCLYCSPSRVVCLKWERKYFENRLSA